MALREILLQLGADTGDVEKKLDHVDKGMSGLVEKMKHAGEALAGAFAFREVSDFLTEQIELGSVLNDTSERLGVSAEALQKFEQAAKLSGVSADEAAHSLGFLNKNMGEALQNGGGDQAKTFERLGVALKDAQGNARPLDDVLFGVAEGLDGLGSQAEKAAAVTSIFGRAGANLLPVLKDGGKELKKLYGELGDLGGILDEDFIHAADAAGDQIDKMKFAAQGFKAQIAMAILPTMTHWLGKLTDWIAAGSKFVKETTFAKTAVAALGIVGSLAFLKIGMGVTKLLGLVAPGPGGFLGSLLGMGQLGLILAGVAALYLIFDDLFALFTGGESVTGEILDRLIGIGETDKLVQDVKDSWQELSDLWGMDATQTAQMLGRAILGSIVVACDALITAGKLIGHTFLFAWDAVGGKLTDADKDLKALGQDMDTFGKHFDKMAAFVHGDAGPTRGQVEVGPITSGGPPPAFASTAFPAGAGAAGGSAGGPVSISTGGNTINIVNNGVSDPKAAGTKAANDVRGVMQQDLQNARSAFKRGVSQ